MWKGTGTVKGQAEGPPGRKGDTGVQSKRWEPAPYLNKAFRITWTQPLNGYFPSQRNILYVSHLDFNPMLSNSRPENTNSHDSAGPVG